MILECPFYKYSGCGNDFIIISSHDIALDSLWPCVPALCHRRHGIGADGVLFLHPSDSNGCYLRIINADGSEASFCGNGIRCAAFALKRDFHLQGNTFFIETPSGESLARLIDEEGSCSSIETLLPSPSPISGPHRLQSLPTFPLYTINVGVPHAVAFLSDIDSVDVDVLGSHLRHHHFFSPEGANINFANFSSTNGKLSVRTYERGVEAETPACGSGAAATAIAACYHYRLRPPVTVTTRGGSLCCNFELAATQAQCLSLRGPARRCFSGSYHFDFRGNCHYDAELPRSSVPTHLALSSHYGELC